MLLPVNGSEKCMTGYCNHNNIFKGTETEEEVLDKHMLFLIKNDLVLSGPHSFQGCLAKAERGETQIPLHPRRHHLQHHPGLVPPGLQNRAAASPHPPSPHKAFSLPSPSTEFSA